MSSMPQVTARPRSQLAQVRKPDLILTDVMMPRLDGFGLLKRIRNDPRLADVPVIMLSARAGEEAKVEGLEAGADDYLIKPFAARELVARVHSNIQMAEVRREANRAVFQSEQRYLMTQDRLSLALSTGRVAVFEWAVDSDRLAIQGPLVEVFGVAKADAEAGLPLEFVSACHRQARHRPSHVGSRPIRREGRAVRSRISGSRLGRRARRHCAWPRPNRCRRPQEDGRCGDRRHGGEGRHRSLEGADQSTRDPQSCGHHDLGGFRPDQARADDYRCGG